jgi:hypothetical protein
MRKITSYLQFMKFTFAIVMVCFTANLASAQFVHPGLSHKKSDLDRMKYMIEAKIDPWYSSYQNMCELATAQYSYTVLGDTSIWNYGEDRGWKDEWFDDDARAAYYCALRWYFEEDERYAEKSIEAIMAWSGVTNLYESGMSLKTAPIWLMIEAAELIRYTYDGWAEDDIQKFEDMLVYPGYSTTTVPSGNVTWYWNAYMFDEARAGNQELCGVRTVAAMGVFMDNEIMYDRAIRYVSNLPARDDDIAYARGPRYQGDYNEDNSTDYSASYDVPDPDNSEEYADWGYCGVLPYNIYPNGQNVESERDQAHTSFSLGLLCTVGEIAWNQSYNFFGLLDSRILTGLEYTLRYCVSGSQTYDDQTEAWEPSTFVDREGYEEPLDEDASVDFIQIVNRTKRNKGITISPDSRSGFTGYNTWELPIAHYVGRGLKTEEDLKWTIRARDYSREENGCYEPAATGQDYTGYGGLLYYRPDYCYGDPISGFNDTVPEYDMNVVPCVLEAENFDYSPINANGRVYYDVDASNTVGEYRTEEDVDIDVCFEGGYQLTSLEDGEWLTYTVAVREAGYYNISINYAAANADGAIQFAFDGEEKNEEVAVPFGDGYSTGIDVYADYTVASKVLVQQGVQAMKVMISGSSDSYVLNSIEISADSSSTHIEAEAYSDMSGVETDTTTDSEGSLQVNSIDEEDWMEYEFTLPYTQNYTLEYRLASASEGEYEVSLDGEVLETLSYTATGGTDSWETQSTGTSFALLAGTHTLLITAKDAGSVLNWIDFVKDDSTCDLTEVIPYFITSNPGGIVLDTVQTDEIYVVPGYTVELMPEPANGGSWSWTGPNGFTSTDRVLDFYEIEKEQDGEYIIEFTNDCGTMSKDTFVINVLDTLFIEAEEYTEMSGVDIADDGESVNSIDAGDWMEYEIYVPFKGNYILDYRVSGITNGSFVLSIDETETESISFDATEDDNTWVTVSSALSISLEEGVQTLKITAASAGFNVDWIQLNLEDLVMPCELPFEVEELTISNETVEWSSGVFDFSCSDSVNVFMDVDDEGLLDTSDYLNIYYKIDGGDEIAMLENSGSLSVFTLSATNIKGETIEIIIRGATNASDKVYTINDIQVSAPPVFEVIEAEDYDSMYGIDTEDTSDSSGDENVGWVHDGDWVMFEDLDLTGAYSFTARVSCPSDGCTMEFRIDSVGGELLGTMDITNTGSFKSWTTQSASIDAVDGVYDVYLVFNGGDGYLFNFNWFQLSATYIYSTDASVTSSEYTVDESGKTITDIPLETTLDTFIDNLTPAEGATFEVYEEDGITVASDLTTSCKVIVTAEDGETQSTYSITVSTLVSSIFMDKVNIYPNPAGDVLYIEMDELTGAKIDVINLLGETILTELAEESCISINLSGLTEGFYIVRITVDDTYVNYKVFKK